MPFDWNDFYTLAGDLRRSSNEDCLRSAISRAYYSVYCQARNYMIAEWGVRPGVDDSVHGFVWGYYRRLGGTCRAIGENGNRLRKNRIDADYEDEIEELDSLVEESFITADKVLAYLQQVKNAPH